jgi:hypothetical protein
MLLGNHVADCDADESLQTQARAETWTAPTPDLPSSQYVPGYISVPKKTLGAAAGSWASMHTHTSFQAAIRAVEDEESTSCVAAVVVQPVRATATTVMPVRAMPSRTRTLIMH